MSRLTQDPVETVDDRGDKVLTHPSFAQLTAYRTSGMQVMYGSDFRHQYCISLELHHSELHRSLARDWAFQKKPIVRLRMSESQWAQFVSSIGVGGGTQVTLEYTEQDGRLPDLPWRDEGTEFAAEGQKAIDDSLALLDETIRVVTENVQGLSKTKQAEILRTLNNSRSKLASTLPFVTKQFEEHLEGRVEKAKAEVNAWMTHTINRAGLDALAQERGYPLMLEAKDES